jgi:hypothetical protein
MMPGGALVTMQREEKRNCGGGWLVGFGAMKKSRVVSRRGWVGLRVRLDGESFHRTELFLFLLIFLSGLFIFSKITHGWKEGAHAGTAPHEIRNEARGIAVVGYGVAVRGGFATERKVAAVRVRTKTREHK